MTLVSGAAGTAGLADDSKGAIPIIPATGMVTIWKKDTTKRSYYLAADVPTTDIDGQQDTDGLTLNEAWDASTTPTAERLGDSDKGLALLVGSSAEKEFILLEGGNSGPLLSSDGAGGSTPNKLRVDNRNANTRAVATQAIPIVALGAKAHHAGDSVVSRQFCGHGRRGRKRQPMPADDPAWPDRDSCGLDCGHQAGRLCADRLPQADRNR